MAHVSTRIGVVVVGFGLVLSPALPARSQARVFSAGGQATLVIDGARCVPQLDRAIVTGEKPAAVM